MSLVYVGLGSNLGDRGQHLNDAILQLSLEVGNVNGQSSFYHSKPWGFDSDNEFLNAVILIETGLAPFDLLNKTQEIEKQLGRTSKTSSGYADRLIDIDILLYDYLIIDQPTLKIPHPHIAERDFVLLPLIEIAPEIIHPIYGVKIIDLKKF